jgi:hypothetical protein
MRISRFLAVLLFVLATVLGGASSIAAQDATTEATPGGPSAGYPIAIHEGTCDNPTAEPAWQIDDAVAVGVDQEEPEVVASEPIRTVTESSGDLDVKLDDLAGTEHIVAVHASSEEFGTLAACGPIGGIKDDGKLVIALTAVGDSGVYGVAILEENDDQTTLTVYVVPPSNDEEATPAA